MFLVDLKESFEKLVHWRPAFHREKVDDLNEQARMTFAFTANRLDQFTQARNKAIVPDSKERPACDVADAGRFDDDRPRPPRREAPVPLDYVWSDKSVFGGSPRNHRRHPGPVLE